jgi:1-deoxy-D-xylulose-5-phosphate reductoisomerase
MKKIAILGSTGSIGTQVLDVVSRLEGRLQVVGLAAHQSIELLAEQIRYFRPSVVSVGREEDIPRLRRLLNDHAVGLEIVHGLHGLKRVATAPDVDVVVVSVAGTVGLEPTIDAINSKKNIALASKEVLVAAGNIVMQLVKEKGVQLIPIDSEHSAIFQCLQGEDRGKIQRIMLTASGGAFANYPLEGLGSVTVEQALAHPTWSMGRKITVDSATLMNKSLEIIEAQWLFGVDASRIEVVIHPQSIVHSMVEFEDGSVIAQLGIPDMRLPIQYALLYPERVNTGLPRLDIVAKGTLTFSKPDPERYPALELGYLAAEQGGTMPTVMNAANEVAVNLFLEGKIGFLDIVRIVHDAMDAHSPIENPTLEQILKVDSWAREKARCLAEEIIG